MKRIALLIVLLSAFKFINAQTNVSNGGTIEFTTHKEVAHPPENLIDGNTGSFFAHMRLEDASWRINFPNPANITNVSYLQGWADWSQALQVEFTTSTGETQIVNLNTRSNNGETNLDNINLSFNHPTSFLDVKVLTVQEGTGGADPRWGGFAEMNVYGNVSSTTDNTPPSIFDVCVTETGPSSAVVSFRTDEPATSMVKFSSDQQNVIQSPIDTELKTCHSVSISTTGNLTGLIDIWATDEAGNGSQQWHHGFSTVRTDMQYGLGDVLLDDDNGDQIYAKDLLAQDGVKSDFVQSWVGMHGWEADQSKDWRNWLTADIIREHVEAGYEFQLLHFFWGDYADRAQIMADDARLKADLRDLAAMIKESGVADQVSVTLQPDWNQPLGDLANWDEMNDYLIDYMDILQTDAPGVKVGLIAGNWDFYHYIPISMSRAALQADFFAFQEMIINPWKDINEVNTYIERAERFITFMRQHFMKPVRWDYLLVSDNDNWESVQQDAVNMLFNNMDRLRAAGLTTVNWMAYQDTPGAFGYYGSGESHKGLKDGNNNAKPAFQDWINGTNQAFANRGVVYDPYSDQNGSCGCVNDCHGDFGGTAYLDNCGVCVEGNTGLLPCPDDCHGDLNGTAFLDNCGVCVEGNTGLLACTQDCEGDWGGTAYIDDCNICAEGNTGRTACAEDCNGDWGGSAILDNCGRCVGGLTGLDSCTQDCDGEWGGTAFIDYCNDCVEGNTGLTACPVDCHGDINGTAYLDSCGTCVAGNTGETACTIDCEGTWGGTAILDSCSSCVGGNTGLTACVRDCNNELGGTAYLDNCFECVGGSTGLEPCDKACDDSDTSYLNRDNIVGYKGSDGPMPGSGIVNTVYALLANDATSGDGSITLDDASGFVVGDLMMIIQMQGVEIRSDVDDETWGEIIDLHNCGNNEVIEIDSVNGNTLFFACGNTLKHSYSMDANTQIVNVPRYSTANVTGTITAQPWNGTTGGIIAMEIQEDLVVDGSIDATGTGFRGGKVDNNGCASGENSINGFVSTIEWHGVEKGESVAGDWNVYDNLPGFPGRYLRGAPANGGGGGNCHNAAGGGGANVGTIPWNGLGNPNPIYAVMWALETPSIAGNISGGGGRGGYTFSQSKFDPSSNEPGLSGWGGNSRRNVGGYGGRPLDNTGGRIFLGGGGGAGDQNDGAGGNGGSGGGIIYLSVCGDVTGTGSILAQGNDGDPTKSGDNDAPGGAGGGGAIIINARGTIETVNISAAGGQGGKQIWEQTPLDAGEAEGGGGGGGGGYIAISAATVVPSVSGGPAGTTDRHFLKDGEDPADSLEWWYGDYPTYGFAVNGGTDGGDGILEAVSGDIVSEPIVDEGHVCLGEVFTFTVSNADPENIIWYDSESGGKVLPCGFGTNWTTPEITGDTTFWVDIICPQLCNRIPARVFLSPSPDLETTDPAASCNAAVDITQSWNDVNNTTGPVTYWFNKDTTYPVYKPTNVGVSGMYYIKKQLEGSECYDLDSVDVTIHPLPLAGSLEDTTLCTQSDVTLSMDQSSYRGDTIIWQSSTDGIAWNDIPLPTINNITVNPTETSNYRAVVSYDGGTCSEYYSSISTVTLAEDVDAGLISLTDTVCSNNIDLAAIVSNYSGDIQWRYALNNNAIRDTLELPGPDSLTIPALEPNSTFYVQTIASIGSCVDSSEIDSIYIEQCCIIPTSIDINPNMSSFCEGNSATISTVIDNPDNIDITSLTYTFFDPFSGDTLQGPSVDLDSITINSSDTIRLGVRLPNEGDECVAFSDTAFIQMIPTALTNVDLEGSDSLCPGGIYTFNVTDSLGGGANPIFHWTINGDLQLTPDDKVLMTNLSVGLNSIKVTMTPDSSCADTTSARIDVTALAPAVGGNLFLTDTICANGTATQANLSNYTGEIQWLISNDNLDWRDTLSSPANNILSVQTENMNTKIYLQAILTNETCLDSSNIDSVFAIECCEINLAIDIDPNTSSFCDGDSVTLTSSFMNPDGFDESTFQYTWFNPFNGQNIAGPSTELDALEMKTSDSVQLSISVPSTVRCIAFSDTAIVEVIPNAVTSVDFFGSDSLCYGEEFSFTITDSLGGGQNPSFEWTINGNTIAAAEDQHGLIVENKRVNEGINTLSIIMTPDSLCSESAIAEKQFYARPTIEPEALVIGTNEACEGEPIQLTLQVNTPANLGSSASINWTINGSETTQTGYIFNSSTLSNNDLVAATVLIPAELCPTTPSTSDDQIVIINTNAIVEAGPDEVVPYEDAIQLKGDVENAITSEWTFDAGEFLDAANPKTTYIGINRGVFTYYLTGENGECSATDSMTITVRSSLFIPDAISPNGDELNEKWIIQGLEGFTNISIKVYNRYGNIVYQSTDPLEEWNGTRNGKPLPVATYFYLIKYINEEGEHISHTGPFTIVR